MPDRDVQSRETPLELQDRILQVLRAETTPYPDDSRMLYASEIAQKLGLHEYGIAGSHGRLPANLQALARRGLAFREPGPGTARWSQGAPDAL